MNTLLKNAKLLSQKPRIASVAQLVEHLAFNQGVVGSRPTGRTIIGPDGPSVSRPQGVGGVPESAVFENAGSRFSQENRMSLSQFAKKVSAKKAVKEIKGDVAALVGFLQALREEGLRISYGAFHAVAATLGVIGVQEVGRPSGNRIIDRLPMEVQPLICRNNGTYAEKTLKKWDQEAVPEGLGDMEVINDAEDAIKAFEQYQEEQAD